ncbi:MAG: 6,7-dimethyl-8-ribityllumazine synthase [Leptospiraceae bacterium]|nr:6,7-dimethyl-8-ribityllumazine synthase [Leptospiraceae bacterium]
MQEISAGLNGAGQKHAVIVSRWNDFITDRLQNGALAALRSHGVAEDDITIIPVPGAYEIGPVARKLAASGRYSAVTCIGAVIRGSTPHFDYVAGQAARLVAQASYDTGVPVLFGVLTTETIEQAIERAGTKLGNKGYEVATAAVEMANLFARIDS